MTKHHASRQAEILGFIEEYSGRYGYPPSVREMMEAVGLSSTSAVHYHLQNAVEDGILTYRPGHGRTYRVVAT